MIHELRCHLMDMKTDMHEIYLDTNHFLAETTANNGLSPCLHLDETANSKVGESPKARENTMIDIRPPIITGFLPTEAGEGERTCYVPGVETCLHQKEGDAIVKVLKAASFCATR